jgi:DNA polymerase-1
MLIGVMDLETNGLYQDVTTIHCMVIKTLEDNKVHTYTNGNIKEGIKLLQTLDKIVMHNGIDYDMRVLEKLTGIKLDVNKITDTLLLSHMLCPHQSRHPNAPASKETSKGRRAIGPHSLENWGYYLGVGKIEYEDWSTFTPEMLERCVGDVEITERLYKHFTEENG